mgnify:CR=1 FL=1
MNLKNIVRDRYIICFNADNINWNKKGKIKYIEFPEKLKGAYQSFTEANISKLREAGYKEEFLDVQEGVKHYLNTLEGWPKNDPL